MKNIGDHYQISRSWQRYNVSRHNAMQKNPQKYKKKQNIYKNFKN